MHQPDLFKGDIRPSKPPRQPTEFKVVALRDCPTPLDLQLCDSPQRAADYWRLHIATHPHFDPERECFAVLLLNTRCHVKGHHLVSTGTFYSVHVHCREIFRAAIIAAAHSVTLLHNHSSGDPDPSAADIKVTRELVQAGRLLKIEVLDHVIIGRLGHRSLRELGYLSV